MATVDDVQEILKKIRALKYELVKMQEFKNAGIMRDMEKEYLDREVKIEEK